MNRIVKLEEELEEGIDISYEDEQPIPEPEPEPEAMPEPEPESDEESEPEKAQPDFVTIQLPPMKINKDALEEFAKGRYSIPGPLVPTYRGLGPGTLNEPIEVVLMTGTEAAMTKFEDHLQYAWPPTGIHDRLTAENSSWSNNVIAEGVSCAPRAVRPKHTDAVSIYRSTNNLGQDTAWRFFNTGVLIHVRPAMDTELIDLETKLAQERSEVGLSSYGQVLSADMGVHLGTLVDFALGLVTHTNLDYEGDMQVALRTHLRGRESIEILLAATLGSMYPHGFPWSVTCIDEKCMKTEEIDLFFGRCQWSDLGRLTDRCMNILHRNQKNLPVDVYKEYYDQIETNRSEFVSGNTTFHFQLPAIADYAMSTRRWVHVIEKEHADALDRYDNPNQRSAYLDSLRMSRSLLQYSHYVGKISIDNDGAVIEVTDRDKIEEILVAASADISTVSAFINEVTQFEVNSRMTVIGHRNRACTACNKSVRSDEGEWGTIVPLPVERLFFTLMQLKINILRGIQNRI